MRSASLVLRRAVNALKQASVIVRERLAGTNAALSSLQSSSESAFSWADGLRSIRWDESTSEV